MMPKRKIVKRKITQDQFFQILESAIRPKPAESDLEPSETLEQNQDDGCSGIDIHSGMTEDTSD